jgi:hypothetical protein
VIPSYWDITLNLTKYHFMILFPSYSLLRTQGSCAGLNSTGEKRIMISKVKAARRRLALWSIRKQLEKLTKQERNFQREIRRMRREIDRFKKQMKEKEEKK